MTIDEKIWSRWVPGALTLLGLYGWYDGFMGEGGLILALPAFALYAFFQGVEIGKAEGHAEGYQIGCKRREAGNG
jgi:hypothetical protein